MGGKNRASLHVDGKEIFNVQLDEPGRLSDSIGRLRAEFMTKLNEHRGTTAHTADEVDMLEEPVPEEEEEEQSLDGKKDKKKRRRNP
ncbi:g326 [Coccomyxa viridis]|uniref:G326 protein n=1 Tax=Coccomyxa viridis TaxID=1274662 RepID=A0ABP1FJ46_9CHLO